MIMSMMFVSKTTNFALAIDPIGQERYSYIKYLYINVRYVPVDFQFEYETD